MPHILPLFMSTWVIKEGKDKALLCKLGFHDYVEEETGEYAGFLAGSKVYYTCTKCGQVRQGQTGLGT